MKTVGEILSTARLKSKLSIEQLAEDTKIRPDYIEAIEANKFSTLPSATFVKGFIRNLSLALDLEPDTTLAVFRRDFDQNQKGKVIPRGLSKPLKNPSRLYNPRTTSVSIALFVILLVGIYLFHQIRSFSQAPQIDLLSPQDNQTTGPIVLIKGSTSTDATLTVNQKPISLNIDGEFETTLDLSAGQHTITIETTSREGKTRTLQRTIIVEP